MWVEYTRGAVRKSICECEFAQVENKSTQQSGKEVQNRKPSVCMICFIKMRPSKKNTPPNPSTPI